LPKVAVIPLGDSGNGYPLAGSEYGHYLLEKIYGSLHRARLIFVPDDRLKLVVLIVT